MYPCDETAAALKRFAVYVENHREVTLDRGVADQAPRVAGHAADAAAEEPRRLANSRKARSFLDDHKIQLTVVQPRRRRDARVVAILHAVGEHDEHRRNG